MRLLYKERPVCSVVDAACMAAANYSNECRPRQLPQCFRCGHDVCRNCSTIRQYRKYGPKRLCNDCQRDLFQNDEEILKRITRLVN